MHTRVINSFGKRVRKRALGIGLSHADARSLASWLMRQCRSRGLEGAVDRMKRVRDAFYHAIYGTPSYPGWVKRSGTGVPKVLSFLGAYDQQTIFRALAAFNVVTLDAPSDRQIAKRILPIVSPPTSKDFDRVCQLVELGISSLSRRPTWKHGKRFRRLISSGTLASLPEDIAGLKSHPDFEALFTEGEHERVWYPLRYLSLSRISSGTSDTTVGTVRGAQEPGCKYRVYADPKPVFNGYLYPLHAFLAEVRDGLASDCTLDQEKGAAWAHSKLKNGGSIHSLDLSAATCRVPLEPQLYMMQCLNVPDHFVRAFTYVATGTWESGINHHAVPSLLSWEVGQPLGIVPSMSAFSLFHNLVLCGICIEIDVPVSDTFRVLGDDVVIDNDRVAAEYTTVMTELGVEISQGKSRSGPFAEFAGYQITRSGYSRPSKWRSPQMANCISLALEYKRPLHREFSRGVVKLQKVILFKNGDYNPPVGEWPLYIQAASMLSHAFDERLRSIPRPFKPMTIEAKVSRTYRRTKLAPRNWDWDDIVEPIFRYCSGSALEVPLRDYWSQMETLRGYPIAEDILQLLEFFVGLTAYDPNISFTELSSLIARVLDELLSHVYVDVTRHFCRTHVNAMMVRGLLKATLRMA